MAFVEVTALERELGPRQATDSPSIFCPKERFVSVKSCRILEGLRNPWPTKQVCQCPGATGTEYHRPGGLEETIILQKSEV